MQLKNIIIGLLVLTNSVTGYLWYRHRDAGALRECVLTHLGTPDEDQVQTAKEYLFGLYADVLSSCGAAVTVKKLSSFAGSPSADMACLLAGKRTVIWETLRNVKYDLENQYEMFTILAKSEGIREINRFSFRPEGERNALLLTKAELIVETEGQTSGINSYLYGLLLGYDADDIEFFYQRSRYMGEYEGDVPFSYARFSQDLKSAFDSFMQRDWIEAAGFANFQQQKNEALQWIKEQEGYSIADLYKQIAALDHRPR